MLENIVAPSEESDSINEKTSDSVIHVDNSPQTCDFHLDCDDLIFLVGGYDGRSWFSSMDCYSPSLNQTKSLKPMNAARCYAPVSILNGELYVFGGGTGGVWYDTGSNLLSISMCMCLSAITDIYSFFSVKLNHMIQLKMIGQVGLLLMQKREA